MTHMLLIFLLIGNDYSHSTNNRSYEAFKSWIMYRLEQCLLNRWSPQILYNLATLSLLVDGNPPIRLWTGNNLRNIKCIFQQKEARVLRIFRALQTSRVLYVSMNARWRVNQLLIVA